MDNFDEKEIENIFTKSNLIASQKNSKHYGTPDIFFQCEII